MMLHSLAATTSYGPIRNGEQLWEIALKVRPSPVLTRYQTMIALQQANPQAFTLSCDLNSLQVGATLSIPTLAEIQAIDAKAAEQEYRRQHEVWKKAHRQKQKVVCTTESSTNQRAETVEPILSVIKTAFSTTTPEPVSTTTNSTGSEKTLNLNSSATTVKISAPTPLSVPATAANHSWFALRLADLAWPIIWGSGLLVLFIIFAISWLVKRRSSKLSPASALSDKIEADNDKPWNFGLETKLTAVEDRMNFALFSTNSETMTASEEKLKPINEVKEKLAYLRTYLAEGEEKVVQKLLKEVVEKGTLEQQEEAQQLLEINKKMSTLELQVTKSSPLVTATPSNLDNPSWQAVVQSAKQISLQQYLPENEAKVFDLVDKIFELLDHELNAQGKLIEAYMNRHRPQWLETTEFSAMNRPNTVVMADLAESSENLGPMSPPPRQPLKPTRHL